MKVNAANIKKGLRYLKHYGFREFLIRLEEKKEQEAIPYGEWYEKMKATDAELLVQRKRSAAWKDAPKISIAVPLYRTPERFLRELIASVRASSYQNWELCFADGTGERDSPIPEIIREYQSKENGRIRYCRLENNGGIAENTNAALAMASGGYLAFLDHDDVITPDALYEVAAAIRKKRKEGKQADLLYSDEDKTDATLSRYIDPHFKPDFNIDLLRANNYITHFLVVRRELAEKAGGVRREYEGAQDYDFVLRCVEIADCVVHIPKILYHWRVHELSTAGGSGSKDYALAAGKRALEDHLRRLEIPASVENTPYFGFYRVHYQLTEKPFVSILIPNKDEVRTLQKCLEAIKKTGYSNYEVIIIENNSEKKETFDFYQKIASEKIKIVSYPGRFNYSKINNFGVRHAGGSYLVLMNNDVEVIKPDWLTELLSVCERNDVGIAGAKLYYPDNTIQHAGLVVGIGGSLRGIGANLFQGMKRERSGYMHRAAFLMDYSAVTAALLMVKRSVYEEVGGFEEQLAVAFNDVDFCLKVRERGYLVVYVPSVEAYHYESKTRGEEDSPEKILRFQSEIEFMRNRWNRILTEGDPYYNKNFSRIRADYSLGDPSLIEK